MYKSLEKSKSDRILVWKDPLDLLANPNRFDRLICATKAADVEIHPFVLLQTARLLVDELFAVLAFYLLSSVLPLPITTY